VGSGRQDLARLDRADSVGAGGGGMKPGTKLIRDQQREAWAQHANGETKRGVARSYDVSQATFPQLSLSPYGLARR
jgi:hypothetical protein